MAGALTDEMHAWVNAVCGVDTKSMLAASAPAPWEGLPTGQPVPPPMSPADAKADLDRRVAAGGALYQQYGQAADDLLPLKDRLNREEQKIGPATVETRGQTAVSGSDYRTTLDERGVTIESKATASVTTVGKDGKVDDYSRERTAAVNIGVGNASFTSGDKMSFNADGKTDVISTQKSVSADLVKGEVAIGRQATRETREEGGPTKSGDKATLTAGMSGVNYAAETSTQVGNTLDSRAVSGGVQRGAGSLGIGGSVTTRKGDLTPVTDRRPGEAPTGPPEIATMDKGVETTRRGSVGAVSDDKGTGLGANAASSTKTSKGEGLSVTNTVAAGGKVQSLVKEVAASDPPRFTITTTISYDISGGRGKTQESEAAKPLDRNAPPEKNIGGETNTKASATVGVTGSLGGSVSFKRELSMAEAHDYLECIKNNGRGSKLPEHKILAAGMKEGWQVVGKLVGAAHGSPEQVRALKPGEELESSFQSAGGLKAGATRGETRLGGMAMGADAATGKTEKITVKKTGMPDGTVMVTATIDDTVDSSVGVSGSYGVAKASHGSTHSTGSGRSIVFSLDPKSEDFDAQLKKIDKANSAAALDKLAADKSMKLLSRTEKDSSSDGVTDGAGIGTLNLSLIGKGTGSNEVTRDAAGNIISSKSVGTSQVGGSLGLGEDLKIADSVTESYTGEVVGGKAKGEVGTSHRHTDLGKTLANLANVGKDPLGAVLNPGKLLADAVDGQGTAIDDSETMGLAKLALDKTKWNYQVGGMRQDEWIATGKKIRAAIKQKGGEIVDVDKTAVQKALAEWTKSSDGERTAVLDRLLRPFGGSGDVAGKGFAFPDGTDQLKPLWDMFVVTDALEAPRTKAKTDPKGALADTQNVVKQLEALRKSLKADAQKWAGFEVQHAEMLGHLNTRLSAANKEVRAQTKALEKPATGAANADDAKHQAAMERGAALTDAFKDYSDNIDQMKTYAEAVFGKLWQAEQKLKEKSLFSGSGVGNLLEADPWIKQAEDEIRIWEKLYNVTYKMWEKLSPDTKLDKAALEKLHVHGARVRLAEVREIEKKV